MAKSDINDEFTCLGPHANYVKLVSGDGHEFFIPRLFVTISTTLTNMLLGPANTTDQSNVIYLQDVQSNVLQKVCHYFAFYVCYTESSKSIPDFMIPPGMANDLIICADFLKT